MNSLLIPRSRRTISLTALIDVVFILLMFFMLTSSFTRWSEIAIESPAVAATPAPEAPELLAVNRDGGIYRVGANLPASLAQLVADLRTSAPVVLLPEANTPVQQIVNALQQLQQAGLTRVSLGQPLPHQN
jgi:biopolymer transport protein ExbD